MQKTTNYGLKKPEQTDFYNVQDFNDNADIIDQKLKENADNIVVQGEKLEKHQEEIKNINTFVHESLLYRWGFFLSAAGEPQIWYEEVVE
ncbi:hypothetical protein U5N28_07835 [Lysinibacillus telephonicus]|uniref:Uncharacterized protein n=1 Tax=Lysinibacillus telephonicus TaxID=1714840 RepID=A0A3S0JQ81_9BACI|nr:hypothetical protein [Lysinibacillus telephonicus]RTQ91615.1 hypothetical protein EKG35_13330 [Lysinibacillus telephonicus]